MKGVIKLKIPSVAKTPKLFVVTLTHDGKQKRFAKVDWDLASAIGQCYYNGYTYSVNDYVCHNELSVDEINSLFKNFRA